ncbi:hypothetical protein [Marinimicrobium koreense]|nr:hypothetical protein [Marinimicrobium koreense]
MEKLFFGNGFVVGLTGEYKTFKSTHMTFGGARLTEDSFLAHWNFQKASDEEVYKHYENRLTDFSLGAFGLLAWTESEWEVALDQLAQYAVFIWREGDDYLISNSLELMIQVLKLHRVVVRKSPENAVEALLYGTSFGGATGYVGVRLCCTTSLVYSEGQLRGDDYDFLNKLYASDSQTYDELLDKTVTFLKSAARNLNPDKVGGKILSDLTGGVDSRMVMSLLMCSSLPTEELEVFCLGSDARADKIVADYLVEKYGFKPGVFYNAKSPEGVSPADSIERGVRRFHGMKLADFGDFGDGRIIGQTKLTGYYGELTRLFYDFEPGANEALADRLVSAAGVQQYFTREVMHGFKRKVCGFLERIDALGVGFEDKLNALYLLNRNKVHFGMSAYLADNTRQAFHPLCSSLFTKLSGKLSREDRSVNRVAFDVIDGLSKNLLCEPMAEKVWAQELFDTEFDYGAYRQSAFVRNGDDPLSDRRYKYGQRNLLHAAQPKKLVDSGFSDRMRKSGAQYHWALLPDVVSRLRFYINRLDQSEMAGSLSQVLEVDRVKGLLAQINFDAASHKDAGLTNGEAKFLLKLLSTFSWVLGDDRLLSVDYTFNVGTLN